jgi:hypothetical protein
LQSSLGVPRLRLILVATLLHCGGRTALGDDADGGVARPLDTIADASLFPEGGCDGPACACPPERPYAGTPCTPSGLECRYTPSFFGCWDGRVTCTAEGVWRTDHRPPVKCPEALPDDGLCAGAGRCSYTVDVGCGSGIAEVECYCLDASWLWRVMSHPMVCDCTFSTSKILCWSYPSNCSWDDASARCATQTR